MSRAKAKIDAKQGSSMGELKRRLFFVLFAILVYRLGSYIPVPGIDPARLADMFHSHQSGLLGMFNMFSGGALRRMTIFALGVMPYISASIIVQLFTPMTPSLKSLQKEGEQGRRKLNQYTRYLTGALALLQSLGVAKWLMASKAVYITGPMFYFVAAVTLVTGTMFLMWLGEQMTERGIGNGISLLIFASIASRLPSAVSDLFMQVQQGQMQVITLLVLVAFILCVIGVIVFMESAQRRIPIQYPQSQAAKGGRPQSHLPLKINMAGVIPVIFAQSILLFPSFLASTFSKFHGLSWLNGVALQLSQGHLVYNIVFIIAIFFFCFFYSSLQFNPKETAERLKKQGAIIDRTRPGLQTAKYIEKIMDRLIVVGAIYLTLVALLPQILMALWHVPFYFGGTSLLIVVVVMMDFVSQVQTHVMSRYYKSWNSSKGGSRGGGGFVR